MAKILKEVKRVRLQTLARILSGRKLTVMFGDTSATDLKTIFLTYMEKEIEPGVPATEAECWMAQKAVCAHEAAHVAFTQKEVWDKARAGGRLLAFILNIVEDARIERCMANDSEGTLYWIRFFNDYIFKNRKDWGTGSKALINGILTYAVVGRIPDSILSQEDEMKLVRECIPFIDQGRMADDTEEAYLMSLKVLAIIKDHMESFEAAPLGDKGTKKPRKAPKGKSDPRREPKVPKPATPERPPEEPTSEGVEESHEGDPPDDSEKSPDDTPEDTDEVGTPEDTPEDTPEPPKGSEDTEDEPEAPKEASEDFEDTPEDIDDIPESPEDTEDFQEAEESPTDSDTPDDSDPEDSGTPEDAEDAIEDTEDSPEDPDTYEPDDSEDTRDDPEEPPEDFKDTPEPPDIDGMDMPEGFGETPEGLDEPPEWFEDAPEGPDGPDFEDTPEGPSGVPGGSGGLSEVPDDIDLSDYGEMLDDTEKELDAIKEAETREEKTTPVKAPDISKEEITKKLGTDLHKGIVFKLVNLPVDRNRYEGFYREMKPFISKAVEEIRKALEYKATLTERNLRKGRLDSGSLWKIQVSDNRLFCKTSQPDDIPTLVIYLLVDCSGSMGGVNMNNAIKAAILLYEVCAALKIAVNVTGFTGEVGGERNVNHMRALGFDDPQENRYAISNLRAMCENRDGYSIRVATRELALRPEKHKVLMILSDGLPCMPYNRYTGKIGVVDTAKAIREAEKEGIGTIGLFFGSEGYIDQAQRIYPNLIFVREVSVLPRMVGRTLKKIITGI